MASCTPRQTANWQRQDLIDNLPEPALSVVLMQPVLAGKHWAHNLAYCSAIARIKSVTVLTSVAVECASYFSDRQTDPLIIGRKVVQVYSGLRSTCGALKEDYFGLRYVELEHKVPLETAGNFPVKHLQRHNSGRCSTTQPSIKENFLWSNCLSQS